MLQIYAREGINFEIHCWYDEDDLIHQIEHFGKRTRNPLPETIAITGVVTNELIDFLVSGNKPEIYSGYNKMTHFYIVRIGEHFSSEQYGTTLYLGCDTPEQRQQIEDVLRKVDHHATIHHIIYTIIYWRII